MNKVNPKTLTRRLRKEFDLKSDEEIPDLIILHPLEDYSLQKLLTYRFIQLLSWEEVAAKLGYSYVHVVNRLYPKAVEQLKLVVETAKLNVPKGGTEMLSLSKVILEILKGADKSYHTAQCLIHEYEDLTGKRLNEEEMTNSLNDLVLRGFAVSKKEDGVNFWKASSSNILTASQEIRDMAENSVKSGVLRELQKTRENVLIASAVKQYPNLLGSDYTAVFERTNTLVKNILQQLDRLEEYVAEYDGNDFKDVETKFTPEDYIEQQETEEYIPLINFWG